MRNYHTGSRPHVQGCGQPLRVRHSARNLTDGGGPVLVRKLFDRLGLGGWIDCRTGKEKGFFRPSLMVEVRVVLLLYGGGVMDDLPLFERRGVHRIFGWVRVPNPTTFGRWLRRAAERMVPLLDTLLLVHGEAALGARGRVPEAADSWTRPWCGRPATAWACAGGGEAPTRPTGRRSGSRTSWGA